MNVNVRVSFQPSYVYSVSFRKNMLMGCRVMTFKPTHTHTHIPACSGQRRKINAVQVVSPATQTENDCFHSSSFHHWFWRARRVVILLHLSRAITHTEQIYIKQWKLCMVSQVYHTPTHWTILWVESSVVAKSPHYKYIGTFILKSIVTLGHYLNQMSMSSILTMIYLFFLERKPFNNTNIICWL